MPLGAALHMGHPAAKPAVAVAHVADQPRDQAAACGGGETLEQVVLFPVCSSRWLSAKRSTWAVETYRKARLVVDSYLIPKLGDLGIRTLSGIASSVTG